MTALSAVYAHYTQKSLVTKWLLFLASIPIAVAGNIGRIISIALVSITAGQQFGTGLHHDWSGYVLFALAISLMIGFGKVLQINYKESFQRWKSLFKPFLTLVLLMSLTLYALTSAVGVQLNQIPGVVMDFPEQVGIWVGNDLILP